MCSSTCHWSKNSSDILCLHLWQGTRRHLGSRPHLVPGSATAYDNAIQYLCQFCCLTPTRQQVSTALCAASYAQCTEHSHTTP